MIFARDHHIQQLEAWTLWNLGEVAYASGEVADAHHCFQAGLGVARQVGDNHMIVSCETGLGSVALMRGEASEAQAHFHAAFQQAVETRAWPLILGLLVRRTEMLIGESQARQERGVEWLAVVLHHPALTQESRTYAERLLDRLRTVLPPEAFAAAWERGVPQTIEDLVEKLRGSIPNA